MKGEEEKEGKINERKEGFHILCFKRDLPKGAGTQKFISKEIYTMYLTKKRVDSVKERVASTEKAESRIRE